MSIPQAQILVLEDDPNIAELTMELLLSEGFKVTSAGSVREGLDLLQDGDAPRCVLVDYELPDGSGVDFARQARARFGEDIVLVAVSRWDPEHEGGRALEQATDYFFHKPVDWTACLDVLRSIPHKVEATP